MNPVKDCHRTKTHADSENVAAVVYGPAGIELEPIVQEFAELLSQCGDGVQVTQQVLVA